MDFVYDEKIKELISFSGTNYHDGKNADKLETLIDGDINKRTTWGVLVSKNDKSHFYFYLYKKSTIWAYGQHYKDSGGSTPGTLFLYKTLDDNSEILIKEIKTKVDEWYILYEDLDKGKYRVKSNNYCQLTELRLKLSNINRYMIKQNNQYYTINSQFYDINDCKYIPCEKDFKENGFQNLNDLIKNIDYIEFENNKKNINDIDFFEFDLNNNMNNFEVI